MSASSDAPPVDASALPRREGGLRSRGGNSMHRTRTAVLDGAARAVEKYGARKATMGDISSLAGIAKGTLYNHFRTKEAVYVAAIDAALQSLTDECVVVAREDLADALALAADRISTHPAVRRIAADEPATLAALQTVGTHGIWQSARTSTRGVLDVAGRETSDGSVEVVLRWLSSFFGAPGKDVERQARLIAAALPRRFVS